MEGLHKEVQRDVFLTNYAFSGMKAELGKSFCANPLFQIQHSFSAGSSQVAPWSFLSMYATDNVTPSLIIKRVCMCVDVVGFLAREFG